MGETDHIGRHVDIKVFEEMISSFWHAHCREYFIAHKISDRK